MDELHFKPSDSGGEPKSHSKLKLSKEFNSTGASSKSDEPTTKASTERDYGAVRESTHEPITEAERGYVKEFSTKKEGFKMFNNIGGKIKSFTKIMFCISLGLGFIVSIALIIVGSYLASEGGGEIGGPIIALGAVQFFVTFVISFVIAMFSYGYGELIENSTIIREIMERGR